MTIIALDFGQKNIGVAVGQTENNVSQPLKVIRRTSDKREFDEIARLVGEWKVGKIVLGLPVDADGNENDACRQIRTFGKKLNMETEFISERHSTQDSNRGLSPKQKRTKGDAYAADNILQSYMIVLKNIK